MRNCEVKVMSFVNEPWEMERIIERENKARRYSRKCRIAKERKEDLWCVASAISFAASMVAMYFLACMFL